LKVLEITSGSAESTGSKVVYSTSVPLDCLALYKSDVVNYCLCQVNRVNDGDIVFVRCVCAQQTVQSDQFKTVKVMDFKLFDVHVPRDSMYMTP